MPTPLLAYLSSYPMTDIHLFQPLYHRVLQVHLSVCLSVASWTSSPPLLGLLRCFSSPLFEELNPRPPRRNESSLDILPQSVFASLPVHRDLLFHSHFVWGVSRRFLTSPFTCYLALINLTVIFFLLFFLFISHSLSLFPFHSFFLFFCRYFSSVFSSCFLFYSRSLSPPFSFFYLVLFLCFFQPLSIYLFSFSLSI